MGFFLTDDFLRTHRKILIKRSQVFKDYLTHQCFVTGGMTVEETDEEMGIFLKFLYSKIFHPENLVTIFKLSTKYKVEIQSEFESMCTSDQIAKLFEVTKELGEVANPLMTVLKKKIQDNPLEILQGQGITDVSPTTVIDIVAVIQEAPKPHKPQEKEKSKTVPKCGQDEKKLLKVKSIKTPNLDGNGEGARSGLATRRESGTRSQGDAERRSRSLSPDICSLTDVPPNDKCFPPSQGEGNEPSSTPKALKVMNKKGTGQALTSELERTRTYGDGVVLILENNRFDPGKQRNKSEQESKGSGHGTSGSSQERSCVARGETCQSQGQVQTPKNSSGMCGRKAGSTGSSTQFNKSSGLRVEKAIGITATHGSPISTPKPKKKDVRSSGSPLLGNYQYSRQTSSSSHSPSSTSQPAGRSGSFLETQIMNPRPKTSCLQDSSPEIPTPRCDKEKAGNYGSGQAKNFRNSPITNVSKKFPSEPQLSLTQSSGKVAGSKVKAKKVKWKAMKHAEGTKIKKTEADLQLSRRLWSDSQSSSQSAAAASDEESSQEAAPTVIYPEMPVIERMEPLEPQKQTIVEKGHGDEVGTDAKTDKEKDTSSSEPTIKVSSTSSQGQVTSATGGGVPKKRKKSDLRSEGILVENRRHLRPRSGASCQGSGNGTSAAASGSSTSSSNSSRTQQNKTCMDPLYGFDPEPEGKFRGQETFASQEILSPEKPHGTGCVEALDNVFSGYQQKSRLYNVHSKTVSDLTAEQLTEHWNKVQADISGILKGNVGCHRHEIFKRWAPLRRQLSEMALTRPFNDEQHFQLMSHLNELFDPGTAQLPQLKEFIEFVALPETCVRIYGRVNNVPIEMAEEEMRCGPVHDEPTPMDEID